MTKFSNKFKNIYIFYKHLAVTHNTTWFSNTILSFIKNNESLPRTLLDGRTERRTDKTGSNKNLHHTEQIACCVNYYNRKYLKGKLRDVIMKRKKINNSFYCQSIFSSKIPYFDVMLHSGSGNKLLFNDKLNSI